MFPHKGAAMESELSTPKTRRENEVWQACDDLWAHSASTRHLTGDNIRDQLVKLGYKRGSPNEIYRYRSSWKDSRGVSDMGDMHPGEVKESDPISRAVSLVYDQLRTQTNDAIDKLTEDYEARLKATLLEEEMLKDALAKAVERSSNLEGALSAAQAEGAGLEQTLLKERREQAVLNERIKASRELVDILRAEHDALVLELKSFHEREIDLWRAQHGDFARSLEAQRKHAQAELERQGASFSEELMQLKTILRQTIEEREQAKAKSAMLEQTLKELRSHENIQAQLEQRQRQETLSWQRRIERYLSRATQKPKSR